MIDITVQNKALELSLIPHILENFLGSMFQANIYLPTEQILLGNCMNMIWYELLLNWSELIYKDIPGCSKPAAMAQLSC